MMVKVCIAKDTEYDARVYFVSSKTKLAKTIAAKAEKYIKAKRFEYKVGQVLELQLAGEDILLIGLDDSEYDYCSLVLRKAVSAATRALDRRKYTKAALVLDKSQHIDSEEKTLQIISEVAGSCVHTYTAATKKKANTCLKELAVLADNSIVNKRAITKGLVLADAMNFTKDLIDRPSNVATPEFIVNKTKKEIKNKDVKFTVFDREESRKKGLHLFVAVGRASALQPQFLISEYKPKNAKNKKPYCLVGKGITFDTGGVSVKVGNYMRTMKADMGGAASMLGTLKAVSDLKLPYHVIAITPLCENAISGDAYKVDDVIESHAGLTVEIANTDAEGRLILADALSYAHKFKPEFIIDAATLTGAATVAVGPEGACIMGNDQELIAKAKHSSLATDDRIWELPLWSEYKEMLKSDVADISNCVLKPNPGTITAGLFLQHFVQKKQPWAHFDIASVAHQERHTTMAKKGATGACVRLFVDMIEQYE